MKVLLLSKYPRIGASSRLRSFQYIPSFSRCGIDVRVSNLFDERYLKTLYNEGRKPRAYSLALYLRRLFVFVSVVRYDVIWIEKEIFPYFPALAERVLKWMGKPYVVDYDDAVFHNYDRSNNPIIRSLLRKKIDVVMRNSACVVAGNEYLADRARKAGAQQVETIPTVVDADRYSCLLGEQRNQLVIGWIGSPSTQRYVVDIRDSLEKVCAKFDARMLLVGATEYVKDQLPRIPVDVKPWSEEVEADAVRQMDVGIMPLEDGPWERGKCGYKLIQYMASGVPVVASPVGVNVNIVRECNSGRLAGNDTEWVAALSELLEDSELRDALGQSGRANVEQKYSLQAQASKLIDVLQTANLDLESRA